MRGRGLIEPGAYLNLYGIHGLEIVITQTKHTHAHTHTLNV